MIGFWGTDQPPLTSSEVKEEVVDGWRIQTVQSYN